MIIPVDLTTTLKSIPWFVDLGPQQLERLAGIATLHSVEPGEVVFQEGDREDCLYVLLEGQVVLELEVPLHGQIVFYTAEALDIIGWDAMTPMIRQRTASARATMITTLVCLNSKLLQQACDEDHELGYVIMRRLANVVATRLLTSRLTLLEIIARETHQHV